jgi:hypothetical protein
MSGHGQATSEPECVMLPRFAPEKIGILSSRIRGLGVSAYLHIHCELTYPPLLLVLGCIKVAVQLFFVLLEAGPLCKRV